MDTMVRKLIDDGVLGDVFAGDVFAGTVIDGEVISLSPQKLVKGAHKCCFEAQPRDDADSGRSQRNLLANFDMLLAIHRLYAFR